MLSRKPVDAATAALLIQDALPLAELGQQLVFGAAVCSQVPLQQCCNYHLGSNAAKHSDLELMGGKSCEPAGASAWLTQKCLLYKQLKQQQLKRRW